MGLFSFFSRGNKRKANNTRKASLRIEALEDRALPSCSVISGYVFQDANNNGIFDAGELPVANSPIELRNAQNVVVGTTTTDASGFYSFDHDATVNTAATTITKTLTFPPTQTNFSLSGLIDQFDPSLGQLTSIDITHDGSITSAISVENTSTKSASTINGTVSGNLTLTGPNGLTLGLNLSANAGSFSALTYDGQIDFGGTSGKALAAKTASGTKTITLTGADMQAFLGTGTVSFTEEGQATSTANGGGNVLVQIESSGTGKLTVVYHYIPDNCLDAGNYTIRELQDPAGFMDGKESRGGQMLNNPPGVSVIPVTLAGADLTHNDFGELKPTSLSGFVYHDINNNGVKDGPEQGIAGVTIMLTGTDDLGPVSKTATTDGTGAYQFSNLRPGIYTVNESQPASWLDGKDTIGNLPGTTSNDQFANIGLASGAQSINNNFGELKASSLAGFVYVDANNNGVKD